MSGAMSLDSPETRNSFIKLALFAVLYYFIRAFLCARLLGARLDLSLSGCFLIVSALFAIIFTLIVIDVLPSRREPITSVFHHAKTVAAFLAMNILFTVVAGVINLASGYYLLIGLDVLIQGILTAAILGYAPGTKLWHLIRLWQTEPAPPTLEEQVDDELRRLRQKRESKG